jgi:hypothetical protein
MLVWAIVAPGCRGGTAASSASLDGGGDEDATGAGLSGYAGDDGAASSGVSSEGGSVGPAASGSSGTPGSGGSNASCLGSSILATLGKEGLLVGVDTSDDPTVAAAPFDIRYEYISGGLFDGSAPCTSCASGCSSGGKSCANSSGGGGCAWWGCYQYDKDPPGEYVRTFISNCAKASPPQIAMFTYYEILQVLAASAGPDAGNVEGAPEVKRAAANTQIMERYFADWRFLLQQIGASRAILHIEPDFWAYAELQSADPTALPAAVASANATDCAGLPNTIAGMGRCLVAMTRKYAPNALVGLHASTWSTNMNVSLNTNPNFDVSAEAQKTASFLAACGESEADLVIVETSDRDAGYYQSIGQNTFWDATNATLPDFHQDFAWVKALTEALGKPALFWQTPLGNAAQNDTTNHWKDNRVDYFFGHEDELAAAHVIGAAFGAGRGDQTLPETDGGNLVAMTKAYVAAGGQAFCP